MTVHVERQSRDVEVAEAPVLARGRKPRRHSLRRNRRARSRWIETGAAAELRAQRKRCALMMSRSRSGSRATAPAAEASGRRDAVGEMRETPQARAAMRSMAEPTAVPFPAASPEQWLQGIDDLKRQGKHEEAEGNRRVPQALPGLPDSRRRSWRSSRCASVMSRM